MKKTHLVAVLLAATFMVSSVPVQAAQEGRVKKSATAAKKQFRTSIDRFKRCMRGRCTRWEAAKVARDVGIAAAAVIAAMYVTGGALKKVGGPMVPELYFVGEALQAPVTLARVAISGAERPGGGTVDLLKFVRSKYLNKKAMYRDSPGYVADVFLDRQEISLKLEMENGKSIVVPLRELGSTVRIFKEEYKKPEPKAEMQNFLHKIVLYEGSLGKVVSQYELPDDPNTYLQISIKGKPGQYVIMPLNEAREKLIILEG